MIKKVEAFEYNGILFKTKEGVDEYKLNEVRKELLNHCWQGYDVIEEGSLVSILNILLENDITSKDKIMKLKELNK